MVSLKASTVPDEDARPSVDICIALDVSGSMQSSNKLNLCKQTTELLINELKDGDRFGLVTFADEARVDVEVEPMTAENKRNAIKKVRDLVTRGCTNLSGGLTRAITLLKDVESPNEVRSVLLLTDGHANRGVSNQDGIVSLAKNCLSGAEPAITTHVFGYGTDHNSDMLRAISEASSGGSYYFVSTPDDVKTAFGDCLGGLLSTAAQNITVTLKNPRNAISKVHSERTEKNNKTGAITVSLGDMYAEEQRDLVIDIDLGSGASDTPVEYFTATVSYIDVFNSTPQTSDEFLVCISRPDNRSTSEVDPHVALHTMRMRVAGTIKSANAKAQIGDFTQARKIVADENHSRPTGGKQSEQGCRYSHRNTSR